MTPRFPLWSDEPSTQDLLAFRAVAETVADALFDDDLDPVAIGLSGAWGSGKTSVLELVKAAILERSGESQNQVLVIPTQPWRYDPAVGPKESLISEVLSALEGEFDTNDRLGKAGLDAFRSLVEKVNWSKAIKMATKSAITMQLPSITEVLNLVSDDPSSLDSPKGLTAFRSEFADLLRNPGLQHLSRVVVLVDDLDRCLPETVVETLEAIRLFLSAEGMSFVIAADEDRVAEAIQHRYGTAGADGESESPARLYLHKIIQTTIPLPSLSRFDTEAYVFLLLAKYAPEVDGEAYSALVSRCDELRINGGSLDDLVLEDGSPASEPLTALLRMAGRLTPILYEKFRGNPRRIKRFLNDLHVRQAIAERRGFKLPADAVAKLMVLERILTDDFQEVLDWLATNQLRDKLDALELAANGAAVQRAEEPLGDGQADVRQPQEDEPSEESALGDDFSETMKRWAKLAPPLDAPTISGYLFLAASFAGIEVVDTGLPERLRDVAAALASNLKLDRAGVGDDTIKALPPSDAQRLVEHLGRRTRDQPTIQNFTVESLLRLAQLQPTTRAAVVSALKRLPPAEVETATVLKLRALEPGTFRPALEAWKSGELDKPARRATEMVEREWGKVNGNK